MSMDTTQVLNGLTPHYAEIFGEKYANLYREHIAGHRLAHDMTIEEYRAKPVILSFGGSPGPSVGKIQDVACTVEDGSEITLRVYYPKNHGGLKSSPSQSLPCYLNVHGGGFVIGGLSDDEAFIRYVVDRCNAIVVDVGYRIAPEYKFPIPVMDCWDAFKHIAKNAGDLGIDNKKIAVGGFSAGGHIAAVISQLARDTAFEVHPCFQLLVIPVCDASALDTDLEVRKDCPYPSWNEHHDAPFLSHARMSWFYKYFLPKIPSQDYLRQPILSPLQAESFKNLPPALVVPAQVDVLRDEGIAYARRLASEGDSWTQLWLAKRVPHPFCHQYEATPVAVEFRELALQRLSEAFEGKLLTKQFISNI